MTTAQERSVPKPVFTDAEAGAKEFPDSTARRFNYYTPQKRKQTHYEDVTVEVQPDPRHYLAQGWLYGFSDGRGGYPLDWTVLKAWGSDKPEPQRGPGSGGQPGGRHELRGRAHLHRNAERIASPGFRPHAGRQLGLLGDQREGLRAGGVGTTEDGEHGSFHDLGLRMGQGDEPGSQLRPAAALPAEPAAGLIVRPGAQAAHND